MKTKTNIKLDLLPMEQSRLKAHHIKVRDVPKHSVDELRELLNVPLIRAMEIYAIVEFQSIPSIGIKFARDLISLGYYSLNDLKDINGAKLLEDLESSTGAWIDPCVEDQCRLVIHYAHHKDDNKRWWDFTDERKNYRTLHGYPVNRPTKAWFELEKYKK